nr:MAG: capsid protein [Cressdnaviricota sp.]
MRSGTYAKKPFHKAKKVVKRPYAKRSQYLAKPKVSKPMKTYIKNAVKREEETKLIGLSYTNVFIEPYNSALTKQPVIPLLYTYQQGAGALNQSVQGFPVSGSIPSTSQYTDGPAIIQGSTTGQRIGNQLHVCGLSFKGFISLNPAVSTTNKPLYVKMFIGRLKNSTIIPNTTTLSQLFQIGGTVVNPTNTLTDINRYVNKNLFTIYATRVFKLGNLQTFDGTNNITNNDFKMTKFFRVNLTKHVGLLRYTGSENTDLLSIANVNTNNKALYVWFVMGNYDGTVVPFADDTLDSPIVMNYDLEYKYKDA